MPLPLAGSYLLASVVVKCPDHVSIEAMEVLMHSNGYVLFVLLLCHQCIEQIHVDIFEGIQNLSSTPALLSINRSSLLLNQVVHMKIDINVCLESPSHRFSSVLWKPVAQETNSWQQKRLTGDVPHYLTTLLCDFMPDSAARGICLHRCHQFPVLKSSGFWEWLVVLSIWRLEMSTDMEKY